MKVLISAYACEPGRGSEPGVGWNIAIQAARSHQVWVLTRADHRQAIEQSSNGGRWSNVQWVYYDLPIWRWSRLPTAINLHYYLWQIGAYVTARQLHRDVNFDVVHHATYVRYWMPCFVALLRAPFVWGPVGGGDPSPRGFIGSLSWRGRLRERLRMVAQRLGECDPFVRVTAARAHSAVASTPATAKRMTSLGAQHVRVTSDVALSDEDQQLLNGIPVRDENPFRVVSIGRLLDWKGFHLALAAFARLLTEVPDAEYWIIGDGPERRALERLARRLGIADRVTMLGRLPRTAVFAAFADCDALVHPSFHDSGGWVCLEAMAAGRPPIVLDWAGPSVQVTSDTGYTIAADSPQQVTRDLADAMRQLAADPPLKQRIAAAGRARVRDHFSWTARGNAQTKTYESLLDPSWQPHRA